MPEQLEELAHDIIRLTQDKKTISDELDSLRERMFNTLIEENRESFEIGEYKITKTNSITQMRTVDKETLINVLSSKIENTALIEEILSEVLKNSETRAGIKLSKIR